MKQESRATSVGAVILALFVLLGGCAPAPTGGRDPNLCGEPRTEYSNDVLGITLSTPVTYTPHTDQYLSDEYGFTLVNSVGEPVVRVAWLHEASADDLDALAREQIDSVPDVPVQQSRIEVDGREATMLAPMPGEVVNTLIFVPVDDRLYTLLFFKEQLDDEDHCLLNSVRFWTPTQSLSSLDLTPSADALHAPPAVETAIFATATAAAQATPSAIVTAAPQATPDASAEWTRHDFVEWGCRCPCPAIGRRNGDLALSSLSHQEETKLN